MYFGDLDDPNSDVSRLLKERDHHVLLPAAAALLLWLLGAHRENAALHWLVEPFLVEPEIFGWMAPFALTFMAGGLALFWAAAFGLASSLSVVVLGDESGYALTDNQQMKLAAMEGMWETEPAPAPLDSA